MKSSRSENVVKNATVTLLMQVIKNILGFVSRTIFIKALGAEYLGVNGLFTEILTVLSFAELGIGNAMVYSLYRPLAEGDTEKIKSLMKLYEKTYRIIGVVIAVMGVCVTPFLSDIVGEVSYIKENLHLLYLLFLLNTVVSYFFVYKKSLIIADQKNYIVDIYQQVFYGIQVVLQSVFLLLTKEFLAYLIIVVICTIMNNFAMARKADKMYPYLRDKKIEKIEKIEIKQIITNVKALVVYKIGGIVLESTDSIFISALVNVTTVGLYSNYKMIVNIFKTIGAQVMGSIIASVGNLNAGGDRNKKESVFREIFYLDVWFFGFTALGLCLFLKELIKVWLGNEFVIDTSAVIAACVYYYIANMHYPCFTYRTTAGLFVYGKYVPLVSATVNIVLDIILGLKWGLTGILWASTIARVLTYELVDPFMVYKHVFNKNLLSYFIMYCGYMVFLIATGALCYCGISLIPLYGIFGLFVKTCIFTIVFNFVFFLGTSWTKEFHSIVGRGKQLIKKYRRL